MQAGREGAGQVALDGELRGGVARVLDGAEGKARRARGRLRRPAGGLPAPGRVAALLQRVRAVLRDRLQATPARLLRGLLQAPQERVLPLQELGGRDGRGVHGEAQGLPRVLS